MAALDMTKVYRDYKGKWVALAGPTSNKVIASGKDLKTVYEKAKRKGIKIPTVAQIPEQVLPRAGGYQLSYPNGLFSE